MTYGRLLERWLKRFGLSMAYTELAALALNRAGRCSCTAQPPFAIGNPLVRRLRGGTRKTLEEKREPEVRRAAEPAERRAIFDASNISDGRAQQ